MTGESKSEIELERKETPTFSCTIFVGLREGYDGPLHSSDDAAALIQEYVNEVGLCVTVTPTTFLYTRGREPGLIIGLMNYPRFPSSCEYLRHHARELAKRLRARLGQNGVSVAFPDITERYALPGK